MGGPTEKPELLNADSMPIQDRGSFEWDRDHNAHRLRVSTEGRTIEWRRRDPGEPELSRHQPAWVPASTLCRLHSGSFAWNFVVDEMAEAQIGVGFMLLWNVGPDWGFFGYLGSSDTAWAYDPSTGDVVCGTQSIEGGLSKFEDGRKGTVTVELHVPRGTEGHATFSVSGTQSKPIPLPSGAVVMPAACFLRETQQVTLAGLEER